MSTRWRVAKALLGGLLTKSVTGLATRKPGCNVEGPNPKRMRMIGQIER